MNIANCMGTTSLEPRLRQQENSISQYKFYCHVDTWIGFYIYISIDDVLHQCDYMHKTRLRNISSRLYVLHHNSFVDGS